MATVQQSELAEFHEYLAKHLTDPSPHRSPEDLLEEWRMQQHEPTLDDSDRLAVEQALEDLRNGDQGIDFDVHMQDLKRRTSP
jgi:hypothetical protein